MSTIVERFKKIQSNITSLKLDKPVNIIAVSKTFPIDHIQPLIDYGHLHFGENKINIHEKNNAFLPHAHFNKPGSLDICFISNKKINYWINKLKSFKIDIIEGPIEKIGAIKPLISIYFRDPDLNLIEISNYIDYND